MEDIFNDIYLTSIGNNKIAKSTKWFTKTATALTIIKPPYMLLQKRKFVIRLLERDVIWEEGNDSNQSAGQMVNPHVYWLVSWSCQGFSKSFRGFQKLTNEHV